MKKLEKKNYHSNLGFFKDEISLLFQMTNSFETQRLTLGLRGYELGFELKLGEISRLRLPTVSERLESCVSLDLIQARYINNFAFIVK